jgi:hypothetical protein
VGTVTATHGVPPELRWDRVYGIAGLSMIAVGLLYLVLGVFTLLLRIPTNPGTGDLQNFSAHVAGGTVTFSLFMVTDLLLIPALLGLYFALRNVNRPVVLAGAALLAFFIVLDLALTEPNWLRLYSLAHSYVHAGSTARAAGYLASAQTALGLVPLSNAISYATSSAALFLFSIALRRSVFGRPVALMGLGINAAGVLAAFGYFIAAFAPLITPVLFAFGLWMILLGARFYRLSVAHREENSSGVRAGRSGQSLGSPKGQS